MALYGIYGRHEIDQSNVDSRKEDVHSLGMLYLSLYIHRM